MRQLITRVDERLHRRLKARAAVQGRSMNAVVTELLEKGLDSDDPRARLRARMKDLGLLFEPPAPRSRVLSHEEVRNMAGPDGARAVIEALEADRSHR